MHQTVPCTYCRTELHVPRVGEVVVREIVHERVVVQRPAFEADLVPNVMRYPPSKAKPASGVALAIFGAFAAVIMLMRCSASADLDKFHAQEASEQGCKDSCPQQCIHADDNVTPSPQTDDPELKKLFAETDQTRRNGALAMCKSTCELECIGIHLSKP